MGAGSSKVVVEVVVDRPFYYAGDTVTGSVVVHVPQALDVKSITLKVSGAERCRWKERKQSGKVTHAETYIGKHIIVSLKQQLHGPGTLAPGSYQWPFSFALPLNVPGTFHYATNDGTSASIEYKVKVDVDQDGLFCKDFKRSVPVEVLQRSKGGGMAAPDVGGAPPPSVSVEQPISAWCCFNRGSIAITASTCGVAAFLPGDVLNVAANVANRSTVRAGVLEFRLHQRLHLVAQTFWGDRHKHVAAVRAISRQQAAAADGSGAAGGGEPRETFNTLASLPLDHSLEATCLGRVVQSHYELEVRVHTGCCLTSPAAQLPILINDPQPVPQQPALVPPLGWAPQVHPVLAFELPLAAYYQQQQQPPALGFPAMMAVQQHWTAAAAQQQQQQQQQANLPVPPAAGPVCYPSMAGSQQLAAGPAGDKLQSCGYVPPQPPAAAGPQYAGWGVDNGPAFANASAPPALVA